MSLLSLQQQVKKENIGYLLNNGRLVALIMSVYSFLWWILFANPSHNSSFEVLWLIAMGILIAIFYTFIRRQLKRPPEQHNITLHSIYFSLMTSMGLLWALGIMLFMPDLPESERLLLIIIVGSLFPLVIIPNLLSVVSFNGFCIPMLLALFVSVFDGEKPEQLACVILWFALLGLNILLRKAGSLVTANFTEGLKSRAKVQELASSHDQMRQQSERDSLTGLYNRGVFERALSQYWRLASRSSTYISVLIIDVDFFKPYNDNYGHVAGDQCLRMVADLLQSSLQREDDLLARYGGEEFVMVLPNTDTQGAVQVADRIKLVLSQAELRHEYSSVASYVTVSVGVSCLIPNMNQNKIDIIDKADRALYSAKANGRNQVQVAARGE